jgi:hypothetical protein
VSLHLQAWALHDAVVQLAREWALPSYRVECRVNELGDTVISLVLARHDRVALSSMGDELKTKRAR